MCASSVEAFVAHNCLVFSREKALSAVVVDEMHLIGDSARGFLLELMLTKQRLLCPNSVQVRGPVAAIPSCCSCCTERPLSGRICVGFVVERLCAVRCCQRGVPHHAVSLRAQSSGPLLSCFVRDHGGFWGRLVRFGFQPSGKPTSTTSSYLKQCTFFVFRVDRLLL